MKEFHPRKLLPGFTAGVIAGMITIVVEISFAALIFGGNLSQFLANGIGLTLFGAFVIITVTTLTSSFPSVIAIPQDTPAALLALMAVGITGSMPVAVTPEETYATVVLSIVITSLLAGGFFFVLGACNMGRFIRYVPHPVVGGFLAGTGWLLVKGSVEVMTDASLTFSRLSFFFQMDVLFRWIPGVLFAVLLLMTLRRSNHFLVMPVAIVLATGLFYLVILLTHSSIGEAGAQGWLINPFQQEKLWRPVSGAILQRVHWMSIWKQLGNMGIILIISAISLLLNISGVELMAHKDIDVNRELKVAGIANLCAGLGGSQVGYHTLSLSALGLKIGAHSRMIGLCAALLCGVTLWFGAPLLFLIPRFVLGGLVFFLGASFLVEWMYDAWFKLSKIDYFLVLFIFLVIGSFGFLVGVGVGVLASVLIFIVHYSRIKVINRILTGMSLRSNVDRSSEQRQLLREKGNQILALRLQGFLFFGTAHTLYQEVKGRMSSPQGPGIQYLVFDFRRVTGFDGSAEVAFTKILRLAQSRSIQVAFTQVSPQFQRKLTRAFTGEQDSWKIHFFHDLDHGVEWCEDRILISEQSVRTGTLQSFQEQLWTIFSHQNHVEEIMNYLEKKEVGAGCVLIRQGETSQFLYFIESGEFAAQLELEGKEPIRLRTMGAGTIFGEIALYLNIPRSASIVATRQSTVFRLSSDALKKMEKESPHLAMAFQNHVICLLAERLVDINRTLQAVSD